MTALGIQRILAAVFLGLGGWALLFPTFVERLGFTDDHFMGTEASAVLIGCFGAQACLCGIVIGLSRFRSITFLVFGLAGSLPFFIFNFYFVFVVKMFSNWMLLDFVGNAAIFALCMIGYRKLKAEEASAAHKPRP